MSPAEEFLAKYCKPVTPELPGVILNGRFVRTAPQRYIDGDGNGYSASYLLAILRDAVEKLEKAGVTMI
jgi:hypothetical protein